MSNLGAYGIDRFDAIVNPPQSAILSVGAVIKKPVVNAAGEVVAGERIDLGLSCDHRVVDGALGAQFLAELRRLHRVAGEHFMHFSRFLPGVDSPCGVFDREVILQAIARASEQAVQKPA